MASCQPAQGIRTDMDEDIHLIGSHPAVLVTKSDPSTPIIHCEKVDQTAEGPRPTGTNIHLALTLRDAVRLLKALQNAQKVHGWPDHLDEPIPTHVPPEPQRH